MSATINLENLTVNTIVGNCNVGTVTTTTDRSIKAASTAFVVNAVNYLLNNFNLLINMVGNTYNITGTKTFTELYLTGGGGTSTTTISLGENASQVNILPPSTTQTITINGQQSLLQSNSGSNNFTIPVVSHYISNNNKIAIGVGIASGSTELVISFSNYGAQSFSTDCTPIILFTCGNGISSTSGRKIEVYNVNNTGFTVIANGTGSTQLNWIAFGF